jgi:hypothetical protein
MWQCFIATLISRKAHFMRKEQSRVTEKCAASEKQPFDRQGFFPSEGLQTKTLDKLPFGAIIASSRTYLR